MTRYRIGPFPILLSLLLLASCRTTGGPSMSSEAHSYDPPTHEHEEDRVELGQNVEPRSELPHTVRDARSRFQVRMPTDAEVEKDTFETDHGPLRTYSYMSKLPHVVYVATFNELPVEALELVNRRKQLLGARDGSLASTGGELLEQAMLTISGHPGIEMAVRVSGGYYRTRIAISDRGMYQVLVAAENEEVFSDLATAFLDSLVIENAGEP